MDEAVCIPLSNNTIGKSMNSTIFPPVTGKIVEQNGLFNLGIDVI